MSLSKLVIKQQDGYESILFPFFCINSAPLGTFLIYHGMAEHHERYHAFAKYLNESGYDVYLYDHRGHGTDKKMEELGFFSSKDGYKKVVNDAVTIARYVKEHNRSDKTILFGHSMGSLILRNVIQQFDEVDCAVICGTTSPSQLTTKMGLILSSIEKKIKGPKNISYFMNHVLFEGAPYRKLCKRTAFDWLSRNNSNVGAYIDDPYCGFICTSGFYNDLIHLTLNAIKPSFIKLTRKDLPILIISGSHDPVGGYGKQVTKFFLRLQKFGFQNVDCSLYSEGRHELLNETNRDEIMNDIKCWVEHHI